MEHYNKTHKIRNFLRNTAIGIGIIAGTYTFNQIPNDVDKILTIPDCNSFEIVDWYLKNSSEQYSEYLCQTLDNQIDISWNEYLGIVQKKNRGNLEGEILLPIFEIPKQNQISNYLTGGKVK